MKEALMKRQKRSLTMNVGVACMKERIEN